MNISTNRLSDLSTRSLPLHFQRWSDDTQRLLHNRQGPGLAVHETKSSPRQRFLSLWPVLTREQKFLVARYLDQRYELIDTRNLDERIVHLINTRVTMDDWKWCVRALIQY